MALQAAKLTEPGARVLVLDAATDQAPLQDDSLKAFVTPDVTDSLAGREVVASRVPVSEPLVDTIRGLGGTDVAVIILATPPIEDYYTLSVLGGLVCDVLFDALVELDITPAVIVDRCDPHEGWYQVDMGYNVTAPDVPSGALPIEVNMAGHGYAKGVASSRESRDRWTAGRHPTHQRAGRPGTGESGRARSGNARLPARCRSLPDHWTARLPERSPNVCSRAAACVTSTSISSFTTPG